MRKPAALAVLGTLTLGTGCQREEIQKYSVPKEPERVAAAPHQHQHAAGDPHAGMNAPARPQIGWQMPEGWSELPQDPQQMRVISFRVPGENNQNAEVAVLPFPGMGGTDLQFVNLWRETIKLPKIEEADLAKYSEDVVVGDVNGKLFDIYGKDNSDAQRPDARITVAVLKREGTTWFFKFTGSTATIAKEKPKFLAFLKSIVFKEADPAAAPPSSVAANEPPGESSGKPQWEVPAGWTEVPPTQMLLARFQLPGGGSTKAEVTVSVFPGDVGGMLANVNRWRGQVGLPAVDQAGLEKVITSLDASGGKATLADMSGAKARLIGVIVPRNGQTWFYKLMADEAVAEREKAAFVKFAQTVKY